MGLFNKLFGKNSAANSEKKSQPEVNHAAQTPPGAGFIPQNDKQFKGNAGDIFWAEGKKNTLIRIVSKEMITLKTGHVYNISGRNVKAPGEDSFMSIGASLGEDHFESPEDARKAVSAGNINWKVMMVPMR